MELIMIRMLIVFILLFLGFWFGISALYDLKKKEKIRLTKLIGYSMICSALTLSVLIMIVVLF